jgi:hypothetical protein
MSDLPAEPVDSSIVEFSLLQVPNLAFTNITSVIIAAKPTLGAESLSWRGLMLNLIREILRRGADVATVSELLGHGVFIGKRRRYGFRYVPDLGLSIQNRDANGTWRRCHELAEHFFLDVAVEWIWANDQRAAFPNRKGQLKVSAGQGK